MLNEKFSSPRPAGKRFPGRLFLVLVLLTATVTPTLAQEIFIDPSVSIPGELEFTVDIAIECAGQSVKGVEVVLDFDPLLLQLNNITPGPWFSGTGLDYFFFDYTGLDPDGTIHFASSVLEGSNNQDLTLAVCHFTALGFGSTPLDFLEVDVRDPANLDLGFGHSTGDLVIIDPAVATTVSSFGAVKALFR